MPIVAMRAYRNNGHHKDAMRYLKTWCDEASVAHWQQESSSLPDWNEIYRRMNEEGRSSKVDFPSPAHLQKQIAPPRLPSRMERPLLPDARSL